MVNSNGAVHQYVILPTRGLRATTPTSSQALQAFLVQLAGARTLTAARSFAASIKPRLHFAFRVLDSIHEDGAKLVEMTEVAAREILARQPGMRIVPVVYYRPALARYQIQGMVKAAAGVAFKLKVTVRSKVGNLPIRGASVLAFTDFKNRLGTQGTTNSQGVAKLSLGTATKIERLYVYTSQGYWGALRKNLPTKGELLVQLDPVVLDYPDALRHYYGKRPRAAGTGVTVGVVDTGVGPHPDLVVSGGVNTVLGEDPKDFGDNGAGHGTHVAGIIAARGTPPGGICGVSPQVTLRSYRVFGKGAEGASNYAIAKAIDRAVEEGCDLINLSLGGGPSDPAIQSAIQDARQKGSLVLAATGNEDRGPVSFPAADPLCIAVSALGRKGCFPRGAAEEGDVAKPFGTIPAEFIAAFSNVGQEVDLTGPGVGILSTVPGGYAPMSGTSMACPAVTGFAARLLSKLPDILAMSHEQARSDALAATLLQAARRRGFTPDLEGNGLPL